MLSTQDRVDIGFFKILKPSLRCIGGSDRARYKSASGGSFGGEDGNRSPRPWSKSRTLSVTVGSGPLSPGDPGARSSVSGLPEEVTLDYTEINSIPPLPLWTLLAADKEKGPSSGGGQGAKKKDDKGYDDLFGGVSGAEEDDSLDSLLEADDDAPRKRRHPSSGENQGLSYFGPRQARILSKLLTHAHLPGLTSLDQMHLLAVADTVSSIQLDLADRFAIDAAKRQMAKETTGDAASASGGGEATPESLDDCGLRFLLAMKHFSYLQRCLPLAQRVQLQKQGLATSYLIWGFHSESEEELLSLIPSVAKNTPSWPELRELGVAWWVRNNTTLRRLMEKVAKSAFQKNQGRRLHRRGMEETHHASKYSEAL